MCGLLVEIIETMNEEMEMSCRDEGDPYPSKIDGFCLRQMAKWPAGEVNPVED